MNRSVAIKLLRAASRAARQAHAPYSRFRVGAALLAADGTVFTGCNVENASFGLTNCAERGAVFSAIAAGKRKFKAIAIVAGGKRLPYPCGACRQVLAEFCGPRFPVLVGTAGKVSSFESLSLGQLLPETFTL